MKDKSGAQLLVSSVISGCVCNLLCFYGTIPPFFKTLKYSVGYALIFLVINAISSAIVTVNAKEDGTINRLKICLYTFIALFAIYVLGEHVL